MKTGFFKILFLIISLAAIVYCLAFFVFGVRLDYEARKAWCGDDKVCRARLWLEYKTK